MPTNADKGGTPRSIIEVEGLVAQYPGNPEPTLHGISMRVRAGEIMVIMGGSGSGKSTLLRHLLGLEKPVSGAIRVLDQDLASLATGELATLRRRFGVAFQGGALFNSMNVGDNLKLPLRELADLAPEQMDIMVRMKLAFVSLEPHVANMMPAELSGGMLKRVAFARAIMMDPTLLFCDEPSAGLDPAVSASIDDLILRLRDALNMTIVVVTHERASAFKIADRITMLDKGHILQVGTLDELRASDNQRIHDLLDGIAEETEVGAWI